MKPILSAKGVCKTYYMQQGLIKPPLPVRALKPTDLCIYPGEVWGLIGESGSGKTTLGRILARLLNADAGEMTFLEAHWPLHEPPKDNHFRKDLQMVFQMAQNPLDPLRTVSQLLEDPIKLHLNLSSQEREQRILALLERVNLESSLLSHLPMQLSGGQRQRICIARAIATEPKFLILDEPVSALDVSVQGQIMNLLAALKQPLGLSYLLITHDLFLARKFCTHIAVMKSGEIVETGTVSAVFETPQSNYTKTLLSSIYGQRLNPL